MFRHLKTSVAAVILSACSSTVLVPVPPRVALENYGTLGIIEFESNYTRAVNVQATRQFQEQVQSAQPGTRFIDLGTRQQALASVGAKELDAGALRRLGEKHRVGAIFIGDLAYSEPKADVKVSDLTKLGSGAVRAEVRGDISVRLFESASGASVWSSSAWARRQLGRVHVSAEHGVAASVSTSDPRVEMVPTLLHHLTHDFRPGTVRQPAR